MKPARLEALADGIFAIVMTLLVLELKVPHIAESAVQSQDLLAALFQLWPKFVTYGVSFIVLSMYWTSHHLLFSYTENADFYFLWRNTFFLLFVGLIPFSTALLGEEPFVQLSQIVYAMNLIIVGLFIYSMWRYVLTHGHMMRSDRQYTDVLRRNVRGKILLPPIIYAVGIAVSFVSTTWSLALFALGPLIYFIHIDNPLWAIIAKPFAPKSDT